jgi:amino acid permease
VWITLFLVAIVIINAFEILGFAEEEFWSSVFKLAAVVIFMIVGLILGQLLPTTVSRRQLILLSLWRWTK